MHILRTVLLKAIVQSKLIQGMSGRMVQGLLWRTALCIIKKGLFIAMPSRKSSDGEYRDIAHPINTQTRDKLQKLVLEAYDKAEDVEE